MITWTEDKIGKITSYSSLRTSSTTTEERSCCVLEDADSESRVTAASSVSSCGNFDST
ncbi:uncharacterized protein J3R85_008119 [Psidium guajava]|nr:uncharacterized protein J3R85_008119 [Psidium guajava]